MRRTWQEIVGFTPPRPPVVATGRRGRSIWDELNEQLPRPTEFDYTPFDWVNA